MTSSPTMSDAVPPTVNLPQAQRSANSGVASFFRRSQSMLPTLVALGLLLGMLIYAEVAYGRVFHAGTISSLLIGFAPTIILAVGMTIVIVSAGIDLSVGAVVAFTSVAASC